MKRLTDAEIPVMGHLGLTPESVHRMSGYRVQGLPGAAIHHLVKDALALEAAPPLRWYWKVFLQRQQ